MKEIIQFPKKLEAWMAKPADTDRRRLITRLAAGGVAFLLSGCLEDYNPYSGDKGENLIGKDGQASGNLPKTEKVVVGEAEKTRQEFAALTLENPLFDKERVTVVDATSAGALEDRHTFGETKGKKSIAIHHTTTYFSRSGGKGETDINHLVATAQAEGASPYDFVIGQKGEVFALTGLDEISGALKPRHDLWLNEQSVNIAVDGEFSNNEPGREQIKSLQFLIYYLYNAFGLAKSDGLLTRDGSRGTVLAHREIINQATKCPGGAFLKKNLGLLPNRVRETETNLVGWSTVRGKAPELATSELVGLIYQKTEKLYPAFLGRRFDRSLETNLDKEVFRFLLAICYSESSLKTAQGRFPMVRPNITEDFSYQTTIDCGPFQVNSKYVLEDNPIATMRAIFDLDYAVEEGVRTGLARLKEQEFDWVAAAWAYKGQIPAKLGQARDVWKNMTQIGLENREGRLRVHVPQTGEKPFYL